MATQSDITAFVVLNLLSGVPETVVGQRLEQLGVQAHWAASFVAVVGFAIEKARQGLSRQELLESLAARSVEASLAQEITTTIRANLARHIAQQLILSQRQAGMAADNIPHLEIPNLIQFFNGEETSREWVQAVNGEVAFAMTQAQAGVAPQAIYQALLARGVNFYLARGMADGVSRVLSASTTAGSTGLANGSGPVPQEGMNRPAATDSHIVLAYNRLEISDDGCTARIGKQKSGPNLLLLLAVGSPKQFRIATLTTLLAENSPFIYSIELDFYFPENMGRIRPEQWPSLLNLSPELLQAVRQKRAILMFFFAGEARSFSVQTAYGPVCMYDHFLAFMTTHDLPATGVWVLNGNLAGAMEYEAWKLTRFGARNPELFQIRFCECYSALSQRLIQLHEAGWEMHFETADDDPEAINYCRRPLNRPATEIYLPPEAWEAALAAGALRPSLYLCMNRAIRGHRVMLVLHLFKNGVLDRGLVSLQPIGESNERLMANHPYGPWWQDLKKRLPLIIDRPVVAQDAPGYYQEGVNGSFGGTRKNWPFQQSYFNFVTETNFYDNTLFVSEKIFTPMLHGQPFVVFGSAGTLAYLHQLGFQTFQPLWSEQYDGMHHAGARMNELLAVVDKITLLSQEQARELYRQALPALRHNYQTLRTMVSPLDRVLQEMMAEIV
ncbi:MAG: hypothetical protein HQL90_10580 [Magnetococcales bacterium]|nr:hypothetical protein [Magnetococcales bacterium]